MTTVLIYKLKQTNLVIKGRWEDGTWILDRRGFSEISHIDEYDAEMLLDRFDGPEYFAVKEIDAPLTISEISVETVPNATRKTYETGFTHQKKRLRKKLENGELDEDKLTDEEIEDIKNLTFYG